VKDNKRASALISKKIDLKVHFNLSAGLIKRMPLTLCTFLLKGKNIDSDFSEIDENINSQ
jgi:hypothetical protein